MENQETMLKEEGRRDRLRITFMTYAFLFGANLVSGQISTVLDSIPSYKVYYIPMPEVIDWGHDIFAARNYLKSSKIESGYWVQKYLSDSTKIARVFRIEHESLQGRDIFFNTEGDIRTIKCYDKNVRKWKVNYKNGIPVDSTRYGTNGIELVVYWYDNGELEYIAEEKYAEHYYQNGKLQLRVNFVNGVPRGQSVYIDLSGNEYHIIWEEGVPDEQYILKSNGMKSKFRFRRLPKGIRKMHFANLFN